MARSPRKFVECSAAATAVEFGIVCLPLLLLIFATIEFGRALWAREALQQTAIAGARCMGLVQSGCGTAGTYSASMTTSYIESQAAGWEVPLTASNITLNSSTTCAGLSGFSQVSITYAFKTLVPKLITPLSGGVQLSATACFPNNAS